MNRTLRTRLWEVVEVAKPGDTLSRRFDLAILALIALNVAAVILESVSSLSMRIDGVLRVFELLSVGIFTLEYIARLWACVENAGNSRPVAGRLRFASRPMSVIDLLAFLPFYLPFLGVDLRIIRVLRLFRIVRVLKVGRYYGSLRLIERVIRARKEELILTTIGMLVLLILSASLMYFAEHDVQPEYFSSIPMTMWWAVATLTTVGYGDVYPVTGLGKALAAIVAILGIGFFALPAGILGSGFLEELHKGEARERQVCPHCGKDIDQEAAK